VAAGWRTRGIGTALTVCTEASSERRFPVSLRGMGGTAHAKTVVRLRGLAGLLTEWKHIAARLSRVGGG